MLNLENEITLEMKVELFQVGRHDGLVTAAKQAQKPKQTQEDGRHGLDCFPQPTAASSADRVFGEGQPLSSRYAMKPGRWMVMVDTQKGQLIEQPVKLTVQSAWTDSANSKASPRINCWSLPSFDSEFYRLFDQLILLGVDHQRPAARFHLVRHLELDGGRGLVHDLALEIIGAVGQVKSVHVGVVDLFSDRTDRVARLRRERLDAGDAGPGM